MLATVAGVRRHPYDVLSAAHRRALRAWLRPRFASFGVGASFDPGVHEALGIDDSSTHPDDTVHATNYALLVAIRAFNAAQMEYFA